jgi:SAM-dependent methyltransferase
MPHRRAAPPVRFPQRIERPIMSNPSFAELEREGWERNAARYDAIDLPATRQAFTPLLDSVGDLRGRHVLELASGTGHLTAEALARGASVVGVDVSPAMVAIARERAPGASFHVADGEALPFEPGTFDAVLCSFGFLHFANPGQGFREARRVLKPGGVLAFTAWCSPERRSQFFGLILGVYEAHANLNVGLPPAPPMFALADAATRDPMLASAGFGEIRERVLPIVWPIDGAGSTFRFIVEGAVRSRMVYERQTPDVRRRIQDALAVATAPYVAAGGIPGPAVLVTAIRT